MRRQFSAKSLRMSIFFEKLIDSNLLFIAVGRPKMFWQKHFEIKVSFDSLKQGCYVIFWNVPCPWL